MAAIISGCGCSVESFLTRLMFNGQFAKKVFSWGAAGNHVHMVMYMQMGCVVELLFIIHVNVDKISFENTWVIQSEQSVSMASY